MPLDVALIGPDQQDNLALQYLAANMIMVHFCLRAACCCHRRSLNGRVLLPNQRQSAVVLSSKSYVI